MKTNSRPEPTALAHLTVWRHESQGARTKGRFLLIHGISEHSGRHLPTVDALTSSGYEVIRFDLRGAGLSGGRRQWVASFSDYVDDVARVYNWIAGSLDPRPLFVLGHSMGGAIAIHFASLYGRLFHGLVLSAPGYLTGSSISPVKVLLGRVLVRVVPTLRLYSEDPSGLSRDPAVELAYKNDPLSYRFNTLQQGKEVLDAFVKLPQLCKKIHNPALMYHGTHDTVIRPEGSFQLLKNLSSKDKELHYLPGGYHEPHLDLEATRVFGLLVNWADTHLPAHQIERPVSISSASLSPAATY